MRFRILAGILALFLFSSPAWAGEFAGDPLARFNTDLFTGSGNCSLCHHLLYDSQGTSLSIKDDWRATMMANAATDPFWQAKVSSEIAHHPALKKIIEKKCLACHMPMAEIEALQAGLPVGLYPGFTDPDNKLHTAAMDGVSCSLCHQIKPDKLGQPESFSGQYVLDKKTKKPARLIYGPFPNPETRTMRTSVGYETTYSSPLAKSAFCAPCHTLYTPYLDAKGEIAGDFPEQTPFLEWLASDYSHGSNALSCQKCHMQTVSGSIKTANFAPRHVKGRQNFAKHYFVGGNSTMLGLLGDNVANLNLTAASSNFDQTRQRTIRQLQEDTAKLDIINKEIKNGFLKVKIRLETMTGHKFPTGIPGRRAWLHFMVIDGSGRIVFESGKVDKQGNISGNDNDIDPHQYEPHYDLISRTDQVQIYETIMANSDGVLTYTLLRAAGYLKDNRLSPAGFKKENVKDDIKVYGKAALDANFNDGSDIITYRVPVSGSGEVFVKAELLYDTVSPAFINDLRKDKTDVIHSFLAAWEKADKSAVVVATASAELN